MHSTWLRKLVLTSALLTVSGAAHAQCDEWTPGLGPNGFTLPPGWPAQLTIASFDPGSGEQAYFGNGASLWSWDGRDVHYVYESPFGFPTIDTLSSGDVGTGPRLFLTHTDGIHLPPRIIRTFDGATWTQIGGASGTITTAGVFDDGTGPAFYVAGNLTGIDGVPITKVGKWTGTGWIDLSAGLPSPFQSSAFASFDDGTGTHLFATSATFSFSTGVLWKWTGAAWTNVTPTLFGQAFTLAVQDFGAGARLFLGGELFPNGTSPSKYLAEWDGTTATLLPFPPGTSAKLRHLRALDLGHGPELFIGADVAPYFYRYDGSTLAPIPGLNGVMLQSAALHGASGDQLVVKGTWTQVAGDDGPAIATFDGTALSRIGAGFAGVGRSLTTLDRGQGPELYAAGQVFRAVGSSNVDLDIGRWTGAEWTKLPATTGLVMQVAVVHGAELATGGPQLFAGSIFNPTQGVVHWDGATWAPLGSGFQGEVSAFATFDFGAGPALVVGGNFTGATGNRITVWDGASYAPLGTGMNAIVLALAVGDLGAGPRLFAGGQFVTAGGTNANGVAEWNGASWSALGTGVSGTVQSACVFDDGSGPALFVGGTFTTAGGAPAARIARWDGASWSALGSGINGPVQALVVHDDGRGPALYAGGNFVTADGLFTAGIARWQHGAFEAVGAGIYGSVTSLASLDDDGDGDHELFAVGDFPTVGALPSQGIARLDGCPHYTSFCFGDGSLADHTTPCPCGNDGAPGRGCASGANASGALLGASGATQTDNVVLAGSGFAATAYGLYLQHDAQDDRVFHDGVLCAGGNLLRLRNRNASGGASQFPDPAFAQDATLTLSQRGFVTPGSGATRYYSVFYRSPAATFCPPATANVTNGLRILW